jgi:nucleoporin NUP42
MEMARQRVMEAEDQIQRALQDTRGAVQYIVRHENKHPNRIDMCKGASATQNPFQASQPRAPAPVSAPSQPANPFAQPARPSNTFGQPSTPINPFATSNAISAPQASSAPTQQNPFAAKQPAFGQTSMPAASPWTTGSSQVSQQRSHSFASPATQQNPFANASAPSRSNPFAQAQPVQITPTNQAEIQAAPPVFTSRTGHTSNPFAPNHHTPPSGFELTATQPRQISNQTNPRRKNSAGELLSWYGKQVRKMDGQLCFQRPDREWERVTFPDPPQWKKQEDLPLDLYDDRVAKEYKHLSDHGTFKDGVMPDLAPKREWIDWNF